MNRVLLANCISLLAGVCMLIGCYTKSRDRTYIFQILEGLILVVSDLILAAYPVVVSDIISAVRNAYVWKNKFNNKNMLLFMFVNVFLCIITNNQGWIGWITVAATVEICICNLLCKSLLSIKISIFVNCALWAVCTFFIKDYVTCLTQLICMGGCVVAIIRELKKRKYNIEEY